ncbi:glycosyltransferase [Oleomonas cavernae]|uniref:Glycosyltransferase n=1 Tax=Oleomonas cavernae TaxID=2320859 RepID=A0A418WAH6_9PROT|nr:glycosyltransferase [Oleomonas cavernae]RJF87061.1 glycosyltransferase [Oleomonas cavernae]
MDWNVGGVTAGREIAVIVPCLNEAAAIGQVVRGFQQVLPEATVYVYDNMSTDDTIAVAKAAGAVVRQVSHRGKGNVVRRMFGDIDADIYIMVDGDGTYDPAAAPTMVRRLIEDNLDMVVGTRVDDDPEAYRKGHRFGNWLLTTLVTKLFGRTFTDMLTGYRVFSRRFVKAFPALSSGFETETEITVHTLELRLATAEIPTRYSTRVAGSQSKLNTYRDGARILKLILRLLMLEKPLALFGAFAGVFALVSIGLFVPIFIDYVATGLVPRFPTLIVSVGAIMLSVLSLMTGIIQDNVTRGRQELKRLFYLAAGERAATAISQSTGTGPARIARRG